ncbi:armadillo-type protein [Pisolithus marmoratus]|nr:armadillo-type protein [Pisolithus marmoratus]
MRSNIPRVYEAPRRSLTENARDGKFRYDRDFLLQFMAVCKERPPNLSSLDFLTIGVFDKPSRKRSGPRCQTGPTPASGVRSASIGIDLGSFTPSGPFAMGQFGTPSTEFTSEERFLMSQSARSAFVGGGPTALPSHSALTQTPGQGGPGGKPGGRHTRSKRGKKHIDLSRVGLAHQGPGFGLSAADVDTSEVANWIVKSLLNKLTVENFDSISDQIVTWANKSENEKDGRTLIQVIKLVLEKATDEANRSEMYARLCRKMMETISPKVQDDGIKNAEGKSITGGQLFRKYLLNRCQDDFERVWAAQENAARTATAKATDDEVIKAANERKGDESELYSDEYYAAQTAKRQGLGLIKFIGELFKLQMLTERIMHECVKKLLSTVENAGEEEIESLCQLLRTVGQLLDVPKARAHMDVYFQRIRELCKSLDVSPRMQSMLLDLIELRDRKWQSPDVMNAPTTLAAVHEAAAKEKAVQEVQAFQRQFSVSYGGSNRSAERNAEPAPDGWAVAGGSQPRLPSKAGDLSHFGKISKAAPMVMGPSSVFAGKKDTKRESITHTNSSPNMFSMLSQNPELVIEAKLSGASRQRPQNLQHLHRTFPAPGEAPLPTPEPTAAPAAQLSGKDTKKMIDEDTKEFFSVRNLEEEDEYLTAPAS